MICSELRFVMIGTSAQNDNGLLETFLELRMFDEGDVMVVKDEHESH